MMISMKVIMIGTLSEIYAQIKLISPIIISAVALQLLLLLISIPLAVWMILIRDKLLRFFEQRDAACKKIAMDGGNA